MYNNRSTRITAQVAGGTQPKQQSQRWLQAIYPALLLALTVGLIGLPSLLEPFGRDQAEYATIADAWLRGQQVYHDIFNVKPPMTHMLHALALQMFGHAMLSIRLLDLFWQIATALCVFVLGWRISGQHWLGWLAGLLYGASYYSFFNFWHKAQTDGFLTLSIAGGMILLYYDLKSDVLCIMASLGRRLV